MMLFDLAAAQVRAIGARAERENVNEQDSGHRDEAIQKTRSRAYFDNADQLVPSMRPKPRVINTRILV